MNVKLKPNQNCQSIQSQTFPWHLRVNSTGKVSKCVIWLSCCNCDISSVSISAWWKIYFIMHSVVPCFDNIYCVLKMVIHSGSGKQAGGTGSLHFRGWNCFMDNEAAFLWPGDSDESTGVGWLGVSMEGRDPCGINCPPGNPHAVRDGIQLAVRRGCRYNPGTGDYKPLQDEISHEFSLEDELLLRQWG